MVEAKLGQGSTVRSLMEALHDVTFSTVDELHEIVEKHCCRRAEIDVIDANDMYGYFGIRVHPAAEVIFVITRRSTPWQSFEVVSVEGEASADWLRFTRWRSRPGSQGQPARGRGRLN
jgi:hypothetical protein